MENSESASSASTPDCPENCAFCQSDGESGAARQLKILKCLHVSCKSCAERFLSYDNTIRCARCQTVTLDPGPGRKLTDWLPTWPARQDEGGLSDPSMGGLQPNSESIFCQHPECDEINEPAEMRCLTCDLLLCNLHTIAHKRSKKSHHHELILTSSSRKPDSQGMKCPLHNEYLQSYCKSCNVLMCDRCHASEQHTAHSDHAVQEICAAAKELREFQSQSQQGEIPNLEHAAAAVEAEIDAINAEAEAISAEINADVAAAVKIIEKRGEDLRRDLDQARWRVLKKLERAKENKEDELRKSRATLLLCKHADDIATLQVLPQPHSMNVSDTGKTDSIEEPIKLEFTFPPIAPDVKSILNAADNTTQALNYSFDTEAKSKGIILSDNGTTATAPAAGDLKHWSSISSPILPVSFRVQYKAGSAFLGFASQNTVAANNGEWLHGSQFQGWSSVEKNREYTTGGASVGQPWKAGDVICLTLDTTTCTATALHERTGVTETISIDKGLFPVCFRAELFKSTCISFLPV